MWDTPSPYKSLLRVLLGGIFYSRMAPYHGCCGRPYVFPEQNVIGEHHLWSRPKEILQSTAESNCVKLINCFNNPFKTLPRPHCHRPDFIVVSGYLVGQVKKKDWWSPNLARSSAPSQDLVRLGPCPSQRICTACELRASHHLQVRDPGAAALEKRNQTVDKIAMCSFAPNGIIIWLHILSYIYL